MAMFASGFASMLRAPATALLAEAPASLWLPPRQSTTGAGVDSLFYAILWISVFFFVLIVALMELTNFRLHNWRVYGLSGKVDKLGRIDKYFDRGDERYWMARLAPVINGEGSQR